MLQIKFLLSCIRCSCWLAKDVHVKETNDQQNNKHSPAVKVGSLPTNPNYITKFLCSSPWSQPCVYERGTSSHRHRLVCNHCASKLNFLWGQHHGSTQLNLLSPYLSLLGLVHVSQNHFLKNSDAACSPSSNAYQLRRHAVLAKHSFFLFVQSSVKPSVLWQNESEHRRCPTSFLWSKNDVPARLW